jgi:hypothetical protein
MNNHEYLKQNRRLIMSTESTVGTYRFYPMPEDEDVVCLQEGSTLIGVLDDIVRAAGHDFVYPCMLGNVIKVPSELADKLDKMIGQKIVLAKVDGKFRVALSSL